MVLRTGQQVNPLGIHYIVTAGVLTVVATIFVGLRFWARIHQARKYRSQKLAVDDALIVVGLVFLYAMTFTSVTFVLVGAVGWPGQDLTPLQKSRFYIVFFVYQLLYALASPIIKLSVILYYKRLFDLPTFRLVSKIVAGLCIAWSIAVILVTIFECSPIKAAISFEARETASCIDFYAYFLAQSISNVLLDVIILIMPMPLVWRLTLDLDRKLFLTGIFMLGGFVVVAGTMRVVYFARVVTGDPYRSLILAAVWTMIEPTVGVISACLPVLRPIYSLCFHRMMSVPGTIRSSMSTRSGSAATATPTAPSEKSSRRHLLSALRRKRYSRDPSQESASPPSLHRWEGHHAALPRPEVVIQDRAITFTPPPPLDSEIFKHISAESYDSSTTSTESTCTWSTSSSGIDPADSKESVV